MNAFIASASRHPRYKYLKNLIENYQTENGRTHGENNSVFTEAIGLLNIERILDKIKSIPHFHTHKYLILATLQHCFGDSLYYGTSIAPERLEMERFLPSEFNPELSDIKLPYPHNDSYTNEEFGPLEQGLRHVMGFLGVSIDDWFMNFRKDSSNRFTMPSDFDRLFISRLMNEDTQDLFYREAELA